MILKEHCLKNHNNYRQQYENTPSLEWDETLAKEAHDWACQLAKLGSVKRGSKGENIYTLVTSDVIDLKDVCKKATEAWYSERCDYDLKRHKKHGVTAHFTQLIWRSTEKVGASATTITYKGMTKTFFVARYFPAGNTPGMFKENVQGKLKDNHEK